MVSTIILLTSRVSTGWSSQGRFSSGRPCSVIATVRARRTRSGTVVTERTWCLVIDVQGAGQVLAQGVDAISVFVLPPSFEVLEERLRGRSGSEVSEEVLDRRLATARNEVRARDAYDYIVVNDELESCVDQIRCIVLSERSRLATMRGPGRPGRPDIRSVRGIHGTCGSRRHRRNRGLQVSGGCPVASATRSRCRGRDDGVGDPVRRSPYL